MVVSLHQREADLRIVELLDVRTTSLGCLNRFDLDDLNGVGTGTVARGHIAVALGDSTANGQITVLAVHVVGTGTGIVAQPDAEVLHAQRSLLQDALDRDDLTGGLLELTQLPQEVPETRLGHDLVRCEDVHLEQRRVRILLRGQLTPDDLVFLQLWIGGTNDNRGSEARLCVGKL